MLIIAIHSGASIFSCLPRRGLQDEAMRETELLQKDADAAKSAFGMACSEMCIGYNHRVFSNNVKLCLEYYSSALKHFSDAGFYEDAYVVSLNIIQTHLARGVCQCDRILELHAGTD